MQDIEARSLDFLCNKALAKSIMQTINEEDLKDYCDYLTATCNPKILLINKILNS